MMNRGIPKEEVMAELRAPVLRTLHLVGAARGKAKQYEKRWLTVPQYTGPEACQGSLVDKPKLGLPHRPAFRLRCGSSGAAMWMRRL
jgi:hypothetical protein